MICRAISTCFVLFLTGAFFSMQGQVSAQIVLGDGFGGGFSRSVSVSNQNGVKTTKVTENGQKYEIRESEDSVEVTYGKKYGPNDMEKLKEKHPDLHMHVTSFPKKSGDATVELTIEVKEVAKAESVDALKEEHPEAHAIYEKFTKNSGVRAVPFGGFRAIPRARVIPAPRIDPAEIEADARKRLEELKKKLRDLDGRVPELRGKDEDKKEDDEADKGKEKPAAPMEDKKPDLIDI